MYLLKKYPSPYIFINQLSELDLISNIIAYYSFDNTLNDSSGNARHLVGSATYSTGKLNSCLNSGIIAKTGLSIPFTTLSFSVWFKRQSSGTNAIGDVSVKNSNSKLLGVTIVGNSNFYSVDFGESGATGLNFGSADVFRHIVVTSDGSGSIKIYKNGVFDSEFFDSVFGTFDEIAVTANLTGGAVDEFAIYSIVLTNEQIAGLYNNGFGYNPFV